MDHAPLIISFLHRAYLVTNRRTLPADEFTKLLDDELFQLRQQEGDTFPKEASAYLAAWIKSGLLRNTWVGASDAPHVDLSPQTEKAIQWVTSLRERSFIGTESRLLTFVELIRQMAEESDPNVERRLEILHKKREELDAEIARVSRGEVDVLTDFELRDRFQQITQLAHGLLADFREVEENFKKLSRSARERIALWDGSKGSLLDEIWRARDEIGSSDQGRSFGAFCDFLLSVGSRDELASLLSSVLKLPAVRGQAREARLERVHYDWIAAGEATQQTVASLSSQLRRFLDDQALLENRRILEIIRNIEGHALALREDPPAGVVAHIDEMKCTIEVPMDRPLFRPPVGVTLFNTDLEAGKAGEQADALYSQMVVDRPGLAAHISATLAENGAVTLRELTELQPLSRGLAELVTYLDLGFSKFAIEPFDFMKDSIVWQRNEANEAVQRNATMPRLLFKERSL